MTYLETVQEQQITELCAYLEKEKLNQLRKTIQTNEQP